MRTRALRALLLVVLAVAGTAAATEPRIATITIEGASRSNRETILTVARVAEGETWREGREAEIRQNLMNAGVYYDVKVTTEERADGVGLTIALREKWTLIPIPLVTVKDGVTTWGVTLFESNLAGSGSFVFGSLAVRDGKAGWALFLMDPHVAGSRWQLSGGGGLGDEEVNVWDAEEKIGSYRRRSGGGSVSLGYRFAERTSIALGVKITDLSFGEPAGEAAAPADARERAVTLHLRHFGTDRDEERARGLSADLGLEVGVPEFGDEVGRTALTGNVRWERDLFEGHTVSVIGHGLWFDTDSAQTAIRPASAFLRGYATDRFAPDLLLGGTIEYRYPVARFRAAKFSIVPFVDAALLRDRYRQLAVDDAQVDAGLALAVYIRHVALPVLQIYGAYGASDGKVLPGLSLGISF